MKATLKKSLALATVFAVGTMSTITSNATNAAVNNATASYSGTAVTVTSAGTFTDANEITFASVKKLDGSAATVTVAGYAATAGQNNVSEITLSADPSSTDNNSILVVSFLTAQGDYGTAQLTVGTPTAHVVNVTATVVPTLSMSLNTNTMALGNLNSTAYQTAAATLTVSTNAIGGATAAMASTGLKSATREIGVTDIAGGVAQTAATDFYKVSTNGTPVLTDANDALANAGGTDMVASQNVYTTSAPVNAAATLITVGAKTAATTEAGSYADTLTFTVTGSF